MPKVLSSLDKITAFKADATHVDTNFDLHLNGPPSVNPLTIIPCRIRQSSKRNQLDSCQLALFARYILPNSLRAIRVISSLTWYFADEGDTIISEASGILICESNRELSSAMPIFVSPRGLVQQSMQPTTVLALLERSLSRADEASVVVSKKPRYTNSVTFRVNYDRTRRPNAKPIERENNPFGHLGKLRCVQCRTWRQKVPFPIFRQRLITNFW